MDNIILIGMPGAGKSTVGVLLAKTLGYAFLDTDLVIQEREGDLLQRLVDRLGVEDFLETEADVICGVDCRNTVIAPGGSAVCRERAREHLRKLGLVVYLRLPLEELKRRLNNISTRGIALSPGQTLDDLYAQRASLYQSCAHLTVEVGSQTLEKTVEQVVATLRKYKKGQNTI